MKEMMQLISANNLVINSFILKNYRKLKITDQEFIIIIYLINNNDKIVWNPTIFGKNLGWEKFEVMQIIDSLVEKKILTITIEKNDKLEEFISLNLFYNKILNLIINKEQNKETDNTIFTIFEQEMGRTLSPMEYEIINGWLDDKFEYDLIVNALKEATYNGTSNFRYIDTILYEWRKKGIKNKQDIINEKKNFRNNKQKQVEVFDYNWLDDE